MRFESFKMDNTELPLDKPAQSPATEDDVVTHDSSTASTRPTDADNEDDFGEFVTAPTNPPEESFFNSKRHEMEKLPLLCNECKPNSQDGIFAGRGLVEPLWTKSDTFTRGLRRAGRMMAQKLRLAESKMVGEERKTQTTGLEAISLSEATYKDMQDLSTGWTEEHIMTQGQRALTRQIVRPSAGSPSLNGIGRPVSLARPRSNSDQQEVWKNIEVLMEAEGLGCHSSNVWADVP